MKHVFNVKGMHGKHCEMIIKGSLKKENIEAQVDLENQTVQVEYSETEKTMEAIKETIEDLGYDVS